MRQFVFVVLPLFCAHAAAPKELREPTSCATSAGQAAANE